MATNEGRPRIIKPQKAQTPKALPPYKPDYSQYLIAGGVILAILVIIYLFSQTPGIPIISPTATPTPTPAATATPTPQATISPSPEPLPTIKQIIVSECGPVSKSIELYNDVETYETCFTIQAEDVTINCNGFHITGAVTDNSSGIYSQFANTKIRNCVINDFELGVRFKEADNSLIENSDFASNVGGLLAERSEGLLVKDSRFFNSTEGSIIFNEISNSIVDNNFVDNGEKYGIRLVGSHKNTLKSNVIYRNKWGLQLSTSHENTIEFNNVSFNSAGVKLTSNSRGNIIQNNLISGNLGVGLHVLDSFETQILKNTVTKNEYGINVYDTKNTIIGNYVCDNSIEDFECKTTQTSVGGNTCFLRSIICEFNCAAKCPSTN